MNNFIENQNVGFKITPKQKQLAAQKAARKGTHYTLNLNVCLTHI